MTATAVRPEASANDALPLPGLDGSNPLGFLAALGTLRVLTDAWPDRVTRMSWSSSHAICLPLLHIDSRVAPTRDDLLNAIENHLIRTFDEHPVGVLDKIGSGNGESRQQSLVHQVDQSSQSRHATIDWLAALVSDPAAPDAINRLQTVRRDYFRGNLKSVIETTTISHLSRCLFAPWDYADALDNQSMHWDPGEDRRHALQWNKPSGDPDRKKSGGMLGANRLAIEAIPVFTSFRGAGTVRTVGFSGDRSTNTHWTWPIWNVKLSLPVIRSLLVLPQLQGDTLRPAERFELREQGIMAAYRTDRILVGKTPNFTPTRRIA